MKKVLRRSSWMTLCTALAIALAGCASTPKTVPALEQAKQDVETARADANAQRYAAKEVEDAGRWLSQAEEALEKRKDEPTVTHLAYQASQTSKIAIEHGKAKSGEERIAAASKEREQIRLEARTQEADQARVAAQQAQAQTQVAQSQAAAAGAQLATEQQRSQQLQAQMEELMAKPSDRGLVITLGDVLFDTGRAELKSGADRQLDQIANFLKQNTERQALIEGFTDSVGTEDYNRALSERRAEAVRSALLSRGVDDARIQSRGYGEEYPVGTNADAGGRQLNRRVEVIVSNDDQPVTPRARL